MEENLRNYLNMDLSSQLLIKLVLMQSTVPNRKGKCENHNFITLPPILV